AIRFQLFPIQHQQPKIKQKHLRGRFIGRLDPQLVLDNLYLTAPWIMSTCPSESVGMVQGQPKYASRMLRTVVCSRGRASGCGTGP
ncbi:hypothetical protein BCR44DRAFT_1443941, partial [Catenaria anguillulae PL171]